MDRPVWPTLLMLTESIKDMNRHLDMERYLKEVHLVKGGSDIEFDPDLNKKYSRRLQSVIDELMKNPDETNMEVVIKDEKNKIESELKGRKDSEKTKYLATLEVLLDLVEIGYNFRKNSNLYVVPPNSSEDPQAYKEKERRALQKERRVQFEDESIRKFIKEMESGSRSIDDKEISDLIADGENLYYDLKPKNSDRDEITSHLKQSVSPYIQVADDTRDEKTGFKLKDIWRYLRYTWLTPYNHVPGRSIKFLIRDGSRKNDPIMGIAALGSPIMNLAVRSDFIGWNIDSLRERLQRNKKELEYEEMLPKDERTEDRKKRTITKTKYLETEEEYEERKKKVCKRSRDAIETGYKRSLEDIRWEDFIEEYEDLTEESFLNPDERTFEILDEIYEEAQSKIEDPEYEDTNPEKLDDWAEKSETPLFRKKRAKTLRELLSSYEYVKNNEDKSDEEFIEDALESKDGRRAIKKGIKAQKKERVGANMMNIMVCGGIPPYNEILSGKLVAMALTGPKVIETYKNKYENQVSKIASSMKGEPKVKSNDLVFLDTTSLFKVGSAQYSRIRVPADNGEIEYQNIGKTKGMGSIQFGPDTRDRLSEVTEIEQGREKVRGRFGEGVGPRMRKIKNGLLNLGLSEELIRHESPRIVFGIELAKNAKDYLRGEEEEPDYYWDMSEDSDKKQKEIYEHWIERWLSKRVQKSEIMERVRDFEKEDFLLSQEIGFEQQQLSDFIVGE